MSKRLLSSMSKCYLLAKTGTTRKRLLSTVTPKTQWGAPPQDTLVFIPYNDSEIIECSIQTGKRAITHYTVYDQCTFLALLSHMGVSMSEAHSINFRNLVRTLYTLMSEHPLNSQINASVGTTDICPCSTCLISKSGVPLGVLLNAGDIINGLKK